MALPTDSGGDDRAKQMPQGAVDPNVKIPQQILDAGKRSEAIQHAIAGTAEPSVAAQMEEVTSAPNGKDPGEHQEPPARAGPACARPGAASAGEYSSGGRSNPGSVSSNLARAARTPRYAGNATRSPN